MQFWYTLSPHYYYGIIPEKFIKSKYSDEDFEGVMKHQRDNPNSELLIIFDDFMGMIKNFHQQNSLLTQQLTRYRHPNTHFSCIFAMHLANHVSPTVRTISTYWVVFRQTSENSAKILYDCAGFEFDNFESFKKAVGKDLVKPTFLLVDKENPDDMYKYLRAPAKFPKITLKY